MCCKSNQISRIHRGTLDTESLEPSCRISPRTMLKKLFFDGGHQFFKISPGIKSLYDWGRKHLFISRGGIIWDRGGNFSKNIDRGRHRVASHRGSWKGCPNYVCSTYFSLFIQEKPHSQMAVLLLLIVITISIKTVTAVILSRHPYDR